MRLSRSALACIILVLAAINLFVWQAALAHHENTLKLSVLDIGQGDSILVQGPTGIQMLVDGGPDRSVRRALPRSMGVLDRSIDFVVETHPDKDHIGGLSYVFQQYRVAY